MTLEELLSKPNLTPAELLHLVKEHNGQWFPDSVNQKDLALLYGNTVFTLLSIEEPRLMVLHPHAEEAWLKCSIHASEKAILDLVKPQIREKSMQILQEIMETCAHRLHPFLNVLWSGRGQWPYFISSSRNDERPPIEQWRILFFGGTMERTELEVFTAQGLISLQYTQISSYVYLTLIQAWVRSKVADVIYTENYHPQSLPYLRRWLAARQHILEHLQKGVPLEHGRLLIAHNKE